MRFPFHLCLGLALATLSTAAELRIGMIGLDTSHVIAFTKLLNQTNAKDHIPGARVVAAFKGGSQDIESSRTRLEGYTRQLEKDYGVKIVPTIEELCTLVDAVMLESVDGRPHLAQARPVINAGKPMFIDKPLAGSLRDAIEIYRLAREKKVPIFSSSSYRFHQSMTELKATEFGEIRSVISTGPAHLESHHPDLFWYGIHPTEALFTVLGRGCEQVSRTHTPDTDVVTGLWSGGRIGILHGHRKAASDHKVSVFGTKKSAEQKPGGGYVELVREIVQFFQTGKAPIDPLETIEMFAFMEAADESKRKGGAPVRIQDVLKMHGYSE